MSSLEDRVRNKVKLHLAYVCTLIMFMSSLDRVNVSFAAHHMEADYGLTPTLYGFGASIFFIGFLAAQFPAVQLLKRIGAPAWFFTLMLTWGIAATSMAFISSPEVYFIMRVVLGLAEGGLAPGMVLYLSSWTSDRDRAGNFAAPMLAIPISIIVGAPLSFWLMGMENNPAGLPGWRWMFLAEGLPTIFLAVWALFHFPRTPNDARWLSAEEKDWIAQNNSMRETPSREGASIGKLLGNPLLWVSALVWFCLLGGAYGLIFWLPQTVRQMSDLTEFEVGLVTALPWVGNVFAIYLNAAHSDKTGERFWHVSIPAVIAAVAFALTATAPPHLALILLFIGGTGLGAAQGAFWSIPTKMFSPKVMATGIVAVNIAGSSAGTVVPSVVGVLRDQTGAFTLPIYIVAMLLLTAALLVVVIRMAGGKDTAPAAAAAE